MARKRLTEAFPWLLPLRKKQRRFFFYAAMRRDGAGYARELSKERLPVLLFESRIPMINESTGFDRKYQENKVFNLQLAAKTIDGLLIKPGETFSFWQAARYADRETPYREGLAEINGRLTTEYGGGLCMLSNLLFWVLLHAPLTVVERHGHREKDFPEPESDAPHGVDATVAEGWLDLKMKNETDMSFQLQISFTEGEMVGRVLASREEGLRYEVLNGTLRYIREDGKIYELAQVLRRQTDLTGKVFSQKELYWNRCGIGYPLPEGTEIEMREEGQ